jgi:hypothetical protein
MARKYYRRRAITADALSIAAEATSWEVRCALRCAYETIATWKKRWKKRGLLDFMTTKAGTQRLIRRDNLILYLISIGHMHPPPEYRLPSREEAIKTLREVEKRAGTMVLTAKDAPRRALAVQQRPGAPAGGRIEGSKKRRQQEEPDEGIL